MRKLISVAGSIALLLTSATAIQAAEVAPRDLTNNIKRAAANRAPFYANNRVKKMCQEWPGCESWAMARVAEDKTFLIQDAEVEHWLGYWEGNKAIWLNRLHVKTRQNSKIDSSLSPLFRIVTSMGNIENSQIKAYVFQEVREKGKTTYPNPTEVKKFPGHPIPGNPSKHARYKLSFSNNSLQKCSKWDECEKLRKQKMSTVGRAVEAQYIHGYDNEGNAIWARSLYVQFFYWSGSSKSFVFRATQKRAGGSYVYQGPQEIKQCPNYPDFSFYKE